jgi:drug/metabolite transporter superfamily protein YnfA
MSPQSRRAAGILLVVLPTVIFGGVSILSLLISPTSGYMKNQLRQDLWRAGHAHAGLFLVLSLVALRYVDEAVLSEATKNFVRWALPVAAILLPVAFFLSVLSPDATRPSGLIYLAYAGAVVLAAGLITLGVGLLKRIKT